MIQQSLYNVKTGSSLESKLSSDQLTHFLECEFNFEKIKHFLDFDYILILGTGGSSLGGQVLDCFQNNPQGPELIFLDNIDPETFSNLKEVTEPESTGVLCISKSGETAETLMQVFTLLDLWDLDYVSQHWAVITEDKPSSLFKIAKHYNFPILNHSKTIGGRYSIFTNVGMSVAFLLGLDGKKIHEGARKYLKDHTIHLENSKSFLKTFDDEDRNLFVIMPYVDRLFAFSLWFRQLWAESVGKNGKGSTPITAQGTVDQHSQLQIYLDGPKDKVFTFLKVKEIERMESVNHPLMPDYLKNKSISDLFKAEEKATIATLSKNNPVRVIEIDTLSEEALGALLMHFISETVLMAEMLNVDPFDQPAVEEGKLLAREYLLNGFLSK